MKSKKAAKTLKVIAILLSLLLISAIIYLITIMTSSDYIKLDKSRLNSINNSLSVLDCTGQPIEQALYYNNTQYVAITDIPQHVIDSFVVTEDKRFFSHHGTDAYRIMGATLNNVKSHSFKEGASTITQQLIKNTHLDNSKTIKRKINEMHLAHQLENNYSKHQILEMYLNTIYFGNNCYGIENASQCYFNKSTKDLTLEEGAVLAGLIKAPNTYSPTSNIDKCTTRRNLVLRLMLKENKITQSQYDNAIAQSIYCQQSDNTAYKQYLYGVINEACSILNMSHVQLINSKLTIKTYYDPLCQQAIEKAIKSDKTVDIEGKLANICAVSCDNATGGIKAMYIRGNDSIDTQKRQVGSTIKPIGVYAPAIDVGKLTSASCILDEAGNYDGYQPSNYNDKYYGWTTATNALAQSANNSAVKVLCSVGVDKSIRYLSKMGISVGKTENLSLALGNVTDGMDIYQLTQAYATLANNGKYNKCTYIQSISNNKGSIYSNNITNRQVFRDSTAYIATYMLQQTVKSGTAKKLNGLPYEVACKTGTVGNSNGNTDAISCCYTSDSTFSMWISGNLSNKITGGSAPCQLLSDTLSHYYKHTKPAKFAVPQSVVFKDIDTVELDNQHKPTLANENIKQNECQSYPFAIDNVPNQTSQRGMQSQQYNLIVTPQKYGIEIGSSTEDVVKIYKMVGDKEVELGTVNDNVLYDSDIIKGTTYIYYGKVYRNNCLIATTPQYSVSIPTDDLDVDIDPAQPKDIPQSILDLLYWRR